MFFIVPKDRSTDEAVGRTENRQTAKMMAERLRVERGKHFDVIEKKLVWTTETIDEMLAPSRENETGA